MRCNQVITSSTIKSESSGRTDHLNAAHNMSGMKHTYIIIVVAANDTKWKLYRQW